MSLLLSKRLAVVLACVLLLAVTPAVFAQGNADGPVTGSAVRPYASDDSSEAELPDLQPAALDSVVLVDNLQPSWDAPGGGGVYAAYYGPPAYSAVSPGTTALYDGREAGIIKAGLLPDLDDGNYWDEGLLGFQVSVDISSFPSQALSYDVQNETGANPVWVRIRLVGGTQYQFVPTSNPAGWHTVDAAAGQWQLMDANGNATGPLMTLNEVATTNPGATVDRVYLTLGMGNSYNVGPGVGTVGWVDKVTIGEVTYDFVVPEYWYVAKTGSDTNEGTAVSPFLTIQKAIDSAVDGDTIHVAAGTYGENVNVNKRVTILGAGSGTDGTVVTGGGGGAGGVVQLATSGLSVSQPILLQALRIQPTGKAGISVGLFTQATGANVSYVELNDVKVVGTNTNPCSEQERGLYVDYTSSLTHLKLTNCAFDNLHYGWYFQKQVSADTSTVQYVEVQNTTFNHNNTKGIYAEKLEDATFTGITVDQNGYDASLLGLCSYFAPWMSGVDVNLKAGTYQNLAFVDSILTNNGLGGAKEGVGIAVKARDDGSTYGAFPATLNNVSITGGQVSGNERGIRFGEPGKSNAGPTGVSVSDVCISGNVKTYSGTDGSAYGGLINQSLATDVAENNWWGDATGPYNATSNPGGAGDAASDGVDFYPWVVDGCHGSTLSVPTLGATTVKSLFCTGQTTDVLIDLAYAWELYGYQFQVSYDQTKASAVGAFDNSFFNTTGQFKAWDADCTTTPGTCKFAVTKQRPATAVSGSGPLAKITLTGVAPGTFNMAISDDVLSDIDGADLPHNLGAALPINICGYANISGFITLQGRFSGNVNTGTVSMIEQGSPPNFTPVAPATFSATDGAYSIQVPYMPGGTSYKILAEHGLYLDNQDTFAVAGNLANKTTRLWGGDANNDGDVTISDLSCIGGDFGSQPPTSTCGGAGGPDINADGKVNIQDLSIAGGNFDKCGAQPWLWQTASPNLCPP
jgi:hypothetical protein